MLGIIRDLNQRRKAAAKSGEECLPTRLHLMFSARAQNELALLEDDIVCEARSALPVTVAGRLRRQQLRGRARTWRKACSPAGICSVRAPWCGKRTETVHCPADHAGRAGG